MGLLCFWTERGDFQPHGGRDVGESRFAERGQRLDQRRREHARSNADLAILARLLAVGRGGQVDAISFAETGRPVRSHSLQRSVRFARGRGAHVAVRGSFARRGCGIAGIEDADDIDSPGRRPIDVLLDVDVEDFGFLGCFGIAGVVRHDRAVEAAGLTVVVVSKLRAVTREIEDQGVAFGGGVDLLLPGFENCVAGCALVDQRDRHCIGGLAGLRAVRVEIEIVGGSERLLDVVRIVDGTFQVFEPGPIDVRFGVGIFVDPDKHGADRRQRRLRPANRDHGQHKSVDSHGRTPSLSTMPLALALKSNSAGSWIFGRLVTGLAGIQPRARVPEASMVVRPRRISSPSAGMRTMA